MPTIKSETPDIVIAKSHPLSIQQQNFVDCIKNEKVNIILQARAGTGKTTTIMAAVEDIVKERLGQCAILAYNKAIAEELKHRLLEKGIDWKSAEAGTVHSFGLRSWKKAANKTLVIDGKKVIKIIDKLAVNDPFLQRNGFVTSRAIGLAKQNGFGFFHGIADQSHWFDLLEFYNLDEDLADRDKPEELIERAIKIFMLSQEKDRDEIDFDDMILAPLVHNSPFWQYDFVFVDEAQDISSTRLALARKLMKPKWGRLIAVGDDRQAIYGFTGAQADSLDHIQKELNSKILPLTVTYRCGKNIVKEANALVPDLEAYLDNQDGVIREVGFYNKKGDVWFKRETLSPKDSVVLCRNMKPLVQLAYTMLKEGIGCRIEGREIGEGLVTLANKWKSVRDLDALSDRLSDFEAKKKSKFLSKGQEVKAQEVEDKCQTLQALIERCVTKDQHEIYHLVNSIRELFGDTLPGTVPNVVVLSTIHKSKGREWEQVFLLDREGTLPSKYARKDWQLIQEANLEYVAITRAKKELVYVNRSRRDA